MYFYSAKAQCCWTFSWIKLKMLLRCCLIYITIIVLRHFMFRIFASMSRPRSISVASMWPIFYFNLTFIAINHITSIKQTHLFFVFLGYLLLLMDDDVMKKRNNSQIGVGSGCCLAFAWFVANFSLLIEWLLIKQRVYSSLGQFSANSNSPRYHWILNTLLQLKNQRSWQKTVWGFFFYCVALLRYLPYQPVFFMQIDVTLLNANWRYWM